MAIVVAGWVLEAAVFPAQTSQFVNSLVGSNTPRKPGVALPPTQPAGFDVILQRVGSRKIQVIDVVREVTGLELAAVKTLVESAPPGYRRT